MLAKKCNAYTKLIHQDGKFYRFHGWVTKEKALLDRSMLRTYSSYDELTGDGWEIIPNTLTTSTIGDYVEDEDGFNRRILGAQGFGEYRLYDLSFINDHKVHACSWTAHELKEEGYTTVQPEFTTQDTVEMSVGDIAKELGHDPKKFKVIDGE